MTRSLAHKLGISQWFPFHARGEVKHALAELRALGVRHVRTGVSWADYQQPGGKDWYDWLFEQLDGFELLVSASRTPLASAEPGTAASPPQSMDGYGAFLEQMIERYGHRFSDIELWNEPGNPYRRDLERWDADCATFGTAIAAAAEIARRHGKRTVLGGVIPGDDRWLALMRSQGVLQHIDVVAIHAFPEMWWDDVAFEDRKGSWGSWDDRIASVRAHAGDRPVWITEIGLATWDLDAWRAGRYRLQAELVQQAARVPAERVYWRSLLDFDPGRHAVEGFHVDENEYHLGLVSWHGDRKPAWGIMKHLLAGQRSKPLAQPLPVE